MTVFVAVLYLVFVGMVAGTSDEQKLMTKLLDGYNNKVRPINPLSNKTEIDLQMTLIQVIGVDEKNEEMSTSMYMTVTWYDTRLTWNESEYGSINIHRLDPDSIWVPNIILENSKDGEFEVSLRTRVLVYSDGKIEWLPPALYKSFCRMEVELFPFDWQNCSMVFRSMDYDSGELLLFSSTTSVTIDEKAFVPNGEWDLISKPIKSKKTSRGGVEYDDLIFYFILLRRPQFYVMNLIIPCILMSMFSCFTFFLPSISGEKMTLSVSVLLGETVFLFLIAQRMPETSLSLPLIAVYLLYSMGLVIICVMFSVIVCNVHFRSSTTHSMPIWVRNVLMVKLANILRVHRPPPSSPWQQAMKRRRERIRQFQERDVKERAKWGSPSEILFDSQARRYGFRARHVKDQTGFTEVRSNEDGKIDPRAIPTVLLPVPKAIKPAVDGVNFIAGHVKGEEIKEQESDDWVYLALIVDRLFFWIYLSAFILGSLGFFLRVTVAYYPEADPVVVSGAAEDATT